MKKVKYRLLKQRKNDYYKIQIKRLLFWVDYRPQDIYGWSNVKNQYYRSEESCHETMNNLFGKQIEFVSPEWEIV